jgi:hypothetical protein
LDTTFQVGDRVQLKEPPPYIKTAEPIPMLRPASLVQVGEEGIILARKPGNTWSIRFQKGAYLLEEQYLAKVVADPTSDPP